MSFRFLLDSNVVSEPLRPFPDPRDLHQLEAHHGEIGIPAPVWHELLFGLRGPTDPAGGGSIRAKP